jgi:dTDP-4-amino-4,6-dideoxygalactose transaminase
MNIPLLDLTAQYRTIQADIDRAIQRVVTSGHFILGEEVTAFEHEIAAYLGSAHGIGVASGTDALVIALRALEIGPGDEVIVPAYTFFASAGAVLSVGAHPVFVDITPLTYTLNPALLESAITHRTKAIMPVHLFGHPAEMDALLEIANRYHLRIIEDNAQAFGALYKGRKLATLGDIGCLSFFPSKNLGGYGDGGMLVTNDSALAEKMRMLRTHGWKKKYYPEVLGYNSRLDALQAAILRAKLPHVDHWNERRAELAAAYSQALAGHPGLTTPATLPGCTHVFHQYILRLAQRDSVHAALKTAGIGADIYYPQPPYLAGPCRRLGYNEGDFPIADQASRQTLAIPIYPEMTAEMQTAVIQAIRRAASA